MKLAKIIRQVCSMRRNGTLHKTGIVIMTASLPFGATLNYIKHEKLEAPESITLINKKD